MERRACNCCHAKGYGINLQGDVVLGCAEDNIWCTDPIAAKCKMYRDKEVYMERTDFTIISTPVKIVFDCPHCDLPVEISWNNLYVPEYWGDDWGEVECPECGKTVELGDYDYD